jgi:hypothetical protein
MTTITLAENKDIYMDEQQTVNVIVNALKEDGTLRDITGANVAWVASFNGVQKIRKDTDTMTVMLAPQTAVELTDTALAGTYVVPVYAVDGFGYDAYGRPIEAFAAGDIVTMTALAYNEYNVIASVDADAETITMVNPLLNTYNAADDVAKIISQFTFQILPGETILPATKSYGTKIVWQHMAQATFPSPLSPENIYKAPTTIVPIRGKMFIDPILRMEA